VSQDIAKRLAGLTPQQREALRLRMSGAGGTAAQAPGAEAAEAAEAAEGALSVGEEALWALDQMEPGNPYYNDPVLALRFRGALDADRLEACVAKLIERHDVLRTSFPLVDGKPKRLVSDGMLAPIARRTLTPDGLSALLRSEAERRFDLGTGPLAVFTLVGCGDQDTVLVVSRHHIVSDARSTQILCRELYELYHAEGDPASGLGPNREDAASFASRQHKARVAGAWNSGFAYWREALADVTQVGLPSDLRTQAELSHRGGQLDTPLPAHIAPKVDRFCKASKVTPSVVFLAGLHALLAERTGDARFCIGVANDGRQGAEFENVVGYFSNILPVSVRAGTDHAFADIVAATRGRLHGALDHAAVPFSSIVRDVNPGRDFQRSPLVQVVFVFNQLESAQDFLDWPGLDVEVLDVQSGTAKFDLTFVVSQVRDGFHVEMEYRSDLMTEQEARALLQGYLSLLDAAVEDPALPLGRLRRLPAQEYTALRHGLNGSPEPIASVPLLSRLTGSRSEVDGGSPYLVDPSGREWSYGEVLEVADRIAMVLRSHGVTRGSLVGICLPPDEWWVQSLLGIVRSGAAYVPIDPSYPASRREYILRDSGAKVVLVAGPEGAETARGTGAAVIDVKEALARPTGALDGAADLTPEDLFYVIYTSGSTGDPKGVVLNYDGRLNNFTDFNERYGLDARDRTLSVSSPAFDMSAFDVFSGPLGGAGLVLPEVGARKDPQEWLRVMRAHGVSVWHSVPALLEMLVTYLESTGEALPESLRLVLLGGDWLPLTLSDRLRALRSPTGSELRIICLGGATEASMDSTYFEVGEVSDGWRSIPYGRPLRNQTVYILDADGNPVPRGAVGELCLGGMGLANGYLGRPRVTADKFIPSPFGTGERLYRTGDLARVRSDMLELELLGRRDNQVQVGGLRIELGEIEAALRAQPGAGDAVAVPVRRDGNTVSHLVAFVVPDKDDTVRPPLDPAGLRSALTAAVPSGMVPREIVVLEAIPLTPNGKIDRRSLGQLAADTGTAAPADEPGPADDQPVEGPLAVLVDTVREVVGARRVRSTANFFDIGGDSIRVIQLVSRLRAEGWSLRPRDVFDHPVLSRLVSLMTRLDTDAAGAPGTLRSGNHAEALSPVQEFLMRTQQREPAPGLFLNVMTFCLGGTLDLELFKAAWQEIVATHAIFRTGFTADGDAWKRFTQDEALIPWGLHDLTHLPPDEQGEAVRAVIDEERERGIPVGRPPLMRLHLFQLAEEEWLFASIDHYALLDGWSSALVRTELFKRYYALCGGVGLPTESKPTWDQYVEAVPALDADRAAEFWRRVVPAAPEPAWAPLVALGAPPAVERLHRSLPPELWQGLRRRARAAGITASVLVEWAWANALRTVTGRDLVTFGLSLSGRGVPLPGVESVVGQLMNIVPVQVACGSDADVAAQLARLQSDQSELLSGYGLTPLGTVADILTGDANRQLFDSVVVIANYPGDDVAFEYGLAESGHPLAERDYGLVQTQWPLRLDVEPGTTTSVRLCNFGGVVTPDEATRLVEALIDELGRLVDDVR